LIGWCFFMWCRSASGLAPAGQLAGLLHPTGELSFVELVGFPHVEGALGFGRKVDRGNGREGGAVEEPA
jgi:hypothetical protein